MEYVNRWNNIYTEQVDVNVVFQDLTAQNIVGQCDGIGTVQIDPTNWTTLQDLGKEQLIFHELGHCVLGLGHNRTMIEFTDSNNNTQFIPESIMYPQEFGNFLFYQQNLNYYHNELKTSEAYGP